MFNDIVKIYGLMMLFKVEVKGKGLSIRYTDEV
jgi:hypothetical protein